MYTMAIGYLLVLFCLSMLIIREVDNLRIKARHRRKRWQYEKDYDAWLKSVQKMEEEES